MQRARRNTVRNIVIVISLGCCFIPSSSIAQQAGQIDHYSAQDLKHKATELQQKADNPAGAAAETLQKYGVDFTMLSVRTKDGGAEVHEQYSDLFIVIDGNATLLSGGELENSTSAAPGEMRGTAVLHGTRTTLSKGDVIHIPPGIPHQLLIPKGTVFSYFVVKVQEKP
ncbi:cupin domain-containing protein [Acidicapsa ligni]|uniref:hypothetical protein n=1 Tax=Acidicapsa ligni TaxID=542300 RepID=UPI0021E0B976|nr:hypothetical protein [Acidicapsa ligni]